MEFPHLLAPASTHNQWDTIYHEHFSYFSFADASARVFAAPRAASSSTSRSCPRTAARCGSTAPTTDDVAKRDHGVGAARLLRRERAAGLERPRDLRAASTSGSRPTSGRSSRFLIEPKRGASAIAGYGAPAKGNTLLNYCGIGTDFIDYTCDLQPAQAGPPAAGHAHPDPRARGDLREDRPDYVLILPVEPRDEIIEQLAVSSASGAGRSRRALPSSRVLP